MKEEDRIYKRPLADIFHPQFKKTKFTRELYTLDLKPVVLQLKRDELSMPYENDDSRKLRS